MNILTFDIEEWFHLLDHDSINSIASWDNFPERIYKNTDRLLSLLEENNQMATFFCLGWIARKHPEIIRRIDNAGHEIGCHSLLHQLVYRQTPAQYREDIRASVGILEEIIGKKVISYRAPGFSITENVPWAFEILAETGILYDSSIFPASRAHGGFPTYGAAVPSIIEMNGISIREFPINTIRLLGQSFVFSGGGYFRLFPYPAIRRFSRQSSYIMTYFHPRDFDKNQPMINDLPINRKFKSYVGLKSCEKKFTRWIKEFSFVDLRTAVTQIRLEQVPVIRL